MRAPLLIVQPSAKSYLEAVGKIGHVTNSNIKIGCNSTDPSTPVSINTSAYQPYAKQSRQHIAPPLKDKLNIKFRDGEESLLGEA